MTNSDCRFGFRIVGGCFETRRLVDAAATLSAYAALDPRCELDKESYLSAFQFDEDFRRLLLETGSTAGYSGPCWSPWLWFDLDAPDADGLHYAHKDAGALAVFLVERYAIDAGDLLCFFSGSKGFHVGLPTVLWSPDPSTNYHKTARRFAEHAAETAVVTIDAGVYDRVRAFRAPNSLHPKSGLHKRHLTLDELTGLSLDKIVELSREPAPFDLPMPTGTSDQATADWQAAVGWVADEAEAKAARRAATGGTPTLNRSTLDFIRHGADQGDRHRLLFSAAANLGEFGCPPALAHTLLEESGLDSGLPPKDVRRQVECGLATVPHPNPLPKGEGEQTTHQDSPELQQDGADDAAIQEPPQCTTGDSRNSQGQTCQQVTGATNSTPAVDLQAALTRLWGSPPTQTVGQAETPLQAPTLDAGQVVLPPLQPSFRPLPPGAVGTGDLDKSCRCGSTEYVDVAISGGRTRRDCRECGKFLGWGKWYEEEGTP